MRMFERYTTTGFSSYEDFVKNFKINAPDDFNFAYDVMDVLAEEKPEKLALLWTNPVSYTHLAGVLLSGAVSHLSVLQSG